MAKRARNDRGAVIVTIAVMITALLAMAALAVDGAYLMELRSQLQNTADAASLAAASGLTVSIVDARLRAADYGQRNPVLGHAVQITGQQMTFGQWDFNANRFLATNSAPNSVRLHLSLSDTPGLANTHLFFAPVLGVRAADIQVRATASLGNRNIILALDRSTSMDDDGINPPQPWTDVKSASMRFLDRLRLFPVVGDRISLVSYNEQGVVEERLTENFPLVRDAIQNLDICYPPACGGYTNIADAMRDSRAEVTSARANSRGLKVVVLLSDGRANVTLNGTIVCDPSITTRCEGVTGGRPEQDALSQARRMKDAGIVLYTISLGNLTNQTLMRNMALETGGDHFFAPTASQLDDVFQQISARIPVVLVE